MNRTVIAIICALIVVASIKQTVLTVEAEEDFDCKTAIKLWASETDQLKKVGTGVPVPGSRLVPSKTLRVASDFDDPKNLYGNHAGVICLELRFIPHDNDKERVLSLPIVILTTLNVRRQSNRSLVVIVTTGTFEYCYPFRDKLGRPISHQFGNLLRNDYHEASVIEDIRAELCPPFKEGMTP